MSKRHQTLVIREANSATGQNATRTVNRPINSLKIRSPGFGPPVGGRSFSTLVGVGVSLWAASSVAGVVHKCGASTSSKSSTPASDAKTLIYPSRVMPAGAPEQKIGYERIPKIHNQAPERTDAEHPQPEPVQ